MIFVGSPLVGESCDGRTPSRYLRLKMWTKKTNIASTSGPKITPMNPNSGRPMTIPRTVTNGWVSAIFFCRIRRITLSDWVMTKVP